MTVLGLGGEGILRTHGYDREAYALINRALDLGITYCESARAYDGSETYYGKALRERRIMGNARRRFEISTSTPSCFR